MKEAFKVLLFFSGLLLICYGVDLGTKASFQEVTDFTYLLDARLSGEAPGAGLARKNQRIESMRTERNVLFVGGAFLMLSALLYRPKARKVCPECAETILAAARKCKNCGHSFAT